MANMSMQQYGKHRGVSRNAVLNAVRMGWLKNSVILSTAGVHIVNSELADEEWPKGFRETINEKYKAGADQRFRDMPGRLPHDAQKKSEPTDDEPPKKQRGGVLPDDSVAAFKQFKSGDTSTPKEQGSSAGPRASDTYIKSRAVRELYQARLTKLEYDEKAGRLMDTEQIRLEWGQLASLVRTKILGLPSKIRQHLVHLKREDQDIIEILVRESLEDITDEVPNHDDDNEFTTDDEDPEPA